MSERAELEPAVPCRVCGKESVVHYRITPLDTYASDEFGLCEEHAPSTTPEEFIAAAALRIGEP